MEETIKKDLIAIIRQTRDAVNKGRFYELRSISDHTIHNASIFQDEDSVSIAVVVYSLFKILHRTGGTRVLNSRIVKLLDECVDILELDDEIGYRNCMKEIIHQIGKSDDKMKLYIEHVITHAEVRKGSKLYEHGISLARAAEVLGVSQWELMNYVGKKRLPDLESEKSEVFSRLSFTRKLFNIR